MVAGLLDQVIDACCRRVVAFLVLDVHCRRADDEVAVDSRGDQDTLAELCGLREDRVADMVSDGLVQQAVVAAPGSDIDLFLTDHVVELVRIDTGRVDDIPCLVHTVVGADRPDRIAVFFAGAGREGLHLGIEEEVDAVHAGIFSHGDIEDKRTNDPAGGGIQGGHYVLREVGLFLQCLFAAQDLQTFDSIGNAPVVQVFESVLFGFMNTDDQGPVPLERNVEVF